MDVSGNVPVRSSSGSWWWMAADDDDDIYTYYKYDRCIFRSHCIRIFANFNVLLCIYVLLLCTACLSDERLSFGCRNIIASQLKFPWVEIIRIVASGNFIRNFPRNEFNEYVHVESLFWFETLFFLACIIYNISSVVFDCMLDVYFKRELWWYLFYTYIWPIV